QLCGECGAALALSSIGAVAPNIIQEIAMIHKSILFLCAALLTYQPARAQDDDPASTADSPKKPVTTSLRRSTLSTAVAAKLNKTEIGRRAIGSDNRQEGVVQINAALTLANQIQRMSGAQARMIPIYQELQEVSMVGPVQGTGTARTEAFADRPAGAPSSTPAEQEIFGQYTTSSIDVWMTNDRCE